jgi:polyhydroxyalkanoate synthesis regulator phasin
MWHTNRRPGASEAATMTNQGNQLPSPDELIETWRKVAADAEQRWNDYFNQLMGTEAFGQIMARSIDSYIAMQSTLARGMEQYLRALNIPSRTDVVQLAERVAMLEHKIDAIAAALGATDAAEPAGNSPARRSTGNRRKRNGRESRAAEG